MKLQKVRLSQFRQFRDSLELADLEPGINLFHGPNESGKSTISQAIRAAFFERHGSGTLGHLQPWGDSSAAPEVSIDFDWNGISYQLSKRFLRQKRCYLQAGTHSYDGDEAEQHLAHLLGFDIPPRGTSKPEHWGIPGLLWIEQGAGQDFRDATGYAADHLQAALEQSAGQLASSEGDTVIRKVQERMDKFLTSANQAPAREYAAALKEALALQTELDSVDQTIAVYRNQVDQLTVLQAEYDKDAADLPWLALRQQEQAASRQLAQAEQIVQDQKRELASLAACQATQKLLHEQLHTIEQRRTQLRSREQARALAQDALQQAELRTASLQAAVEQARKLWTAANAELLQARSAQVQQGKANALQSAAANLAELQSTVAQAQAVHDELQQQRQTALKWHIDAKQLKRLQDLHHQLTALSVRQESVATRLFVDLDDGMSLQVDGQSVQGQGEYPLLKSTELLMPGLGSLRIVPGGQDLDQLDSQYRSTQAEYHAILTQMAVADLSAALARADYSAQLQAAISQNEARLTVYAPKGMQSLLDRVAQQQQVVQQLRQELPPVQSAMAEPPVLAVAEAQAAQTDQTLKGAETAFHQHMATLASVRTADQTAQLEYQHAKAAVAQLDEQGYEQDVLRQLHQQRAQEQALTACIADYQQRIQLVKPDILRQDIQRYAASAQHLEQAHSLRERRMLTLHAELHAAGAQGLEEQRSTLAGQLALVQRRVAEFSRNAQALKLLHGLLLSKRQELTQRLQAPLQKHLDHYLQLLFPQGKLSVDENLVPSLLDRSASGGTDTAMADVAALSFGAREQLGLISRLAYADLLSAAGKPTLIMLDDALVHTDAQRLSQMKRILFDAAQRHQILLFTCHPDNWRDLGVAPRNIY